MKTTIDIAGNILQRSRALARSEHVTLKELVERGLERILNERQTRKPYRLKAVTFKGNGLSPEFKTANWDRIRDAAYRGHGA